MGYILGITGTAGINRPRRRSKMTEENKRPLNNEELATLDKAAAALVKARPVLTSRFNNMQCVSDVILLLWNVTDEARQPLKLN